MSPGDKLICTGPGSTLLVKGKTYTVADIACDGLIETRELRGFLFGDWRFKTAIPDIQNADERARGTSGLDGSGTPPSGGAA